VSPSSGKNMTVFKDKTMDNVQKHNICINVPSSQTFRSYLNAVCNDKFFNSISAAVASRK
jgi:hypothetical protein